MMAYSVSQNSGDFPANSAPYPYYNGANEDNGGRFGGRSPAWYSNSSGPPAGPQPEIENMYYGGGYGQRPVGLGQPDPQQFQQPHGMALGGPTLNGWNSNIPDGGYYNMPNGMVGGNVPAVSGPAVSGPGGGFWAGPEPHQRPAPPVGSHPNQWSSYGSDVPVSAGFGPSFAPKMTDNLAPSATRMPQYMSEEAPPMDSNSEPIGGGDRGWASSIWRRRAAAKTEEKENNGGDVGGQRFGNAVSSSREMDAFGKDAFSYNERDDFFVIKPEDGQEDSDAEGILKSLGGLGIHQTPSIIPTISAPTSARLVGDEIDHIVGSGRLNSFGLGATIGSTAGPSPIGMPPVSQAQGVLLPANTQQHMPTATAAPAQATAPQAVAQPPATSAPQVSQEKTSRSSRRRRKKQEQRGGGSESGSVVEAPASFQQDSSASQLTQQANSEAAPSSSPPSSGGQAVRSQGTNRSKSHEGVVKDGQQGHLYHYEVQFKGNRADRYCFRGESPIAVGTYVYCEGDRGEDVGCVVRSDIGPPEKENGKSKHAKKVFRLAYDHEIAQLQTKKVDEMNATYLCQKKTAQKNLPMEVVDAEFQFDKQKLTFYFLSNQRIDFRELVRELYAVFKARIWMQHVGESLPTSYGQGNNNQKSQSN